MRNRYLERFDRLVKVRIVGSNINNYLRRVIKKKINIIFVCWAKLCFGTILFDYIKSFVARIFVWHNIKIGVFAYYFNFIVICSI